jgi:hypothetical protein
MAVLLSCLVCVGGVAALAVLERVPVHTRRKSGPSF